MKIQNNESTKTNSQLVSPIIPRKVHPARIAFVGYCPYDSKAKTPFSASHYAKLKAVCANAGVELDQCMQANLLLCNKIKENGFDEEDYEEGKELLIAGLQAFRPNVIVPLGDAANKFFGGDSIDNSRGYPYRTAVGNVVCVPTYHPVDLFKRHHLTVLSVLDVEKAVRLGENGWTVREPEIRSYPSFSEIVHTLNQLKNRKQLLSADIETTFGDPNYMTCIGFAWSPWEAFVVPFVLRGKRIWSVEQEVKITRLVAEVLRDCPILGQNYAHFDNRFLHKYHAIHSVPVEDAMFAQWETAPEMEKSLGFQCSIHTDFPYHKNLLKNARRGIIDPKMEFHYCGMDCCRTFYCFNKIKEDLIELGQDSYEHYRFNIRLIRPFQYMGLKGYKIDLDKRDERLKELTYNSMVEEATINEMVGYEVNVRSPNQMKELLYEKLKLPKKYKPAVTKDGEKVDRETADYLTMLLLSRDYPNIKVLKHIAKLRKVLKRISSLKAMQLNPKTGLAYWEHGLVNTDTGRVAGYKPSDGFGVQPQNVDRRDRDLFIAPDGMLWCKADLEGSDSATQGAQLQAVGYSTLLDDMKAGLKPAQALALAFMKGEYVMELKTEEIKKLLPELNARVKLEKASGKRTIYDIYKMVSHGSAYMLTPGGMSLNIFRQTEGEVNMFPNECEKAQKVFFKRYPLGKLHERMRTVMNSYGMLDTPGGTKRTFFGRPDDNTLRAMLAFVPQHVTTYAINLLVEKLFYQPENRLPAPNQHRLYMDLLNQVHDEVDFCFHEEHLDKVRQVFHSFTDNEFEHWGVKYSIQIDAEYGTNWGDLPNVL